MNYLLPAVIFMGCVAYLAFYIYALPEVYPPIKTACVFDQDCALVDNMCNPEFGKCFNRLHAPQTPYLDEIQGMCLEKEVKYRGCACENKICVPKLAASKL